MKYIVSAYIADLGVFFANGLARRPYQREIIEAALSGHDVYVQAATSFGKSLCFQLPAVIDQGSMLIVTRCTTTH